MHQKDCKDGYGVVLIGIKSNLLTKLIDLNTSCEICAIVIQLSQNQYVLINAYRPPNRDVMYQQELCNCICKIVRRYPIYIQDTQCTILECPPVGKSAKYLVSQKLSWDASRWHVHVPRHPNP